MDILWTWATITASGMSYPPLFLCSLMFNTNVITSRPGSEYQIATGQVYANATRVLMEAGPEAGSMFWSLSVTLPFFSFFLFW